MLIINKNILKQKLWQELTFPKQINKMNLEINNEHIKKLQK